MWSPNTDTWTKDIGGQTQCMCIAVSLPTKTSSPLYPLSKGPPVCKYIHTDGRQYQGGSSHQVLTSLLNITITKSVYHQPTAAQQSL